MEKESLHGQKEKADSLFTVKKYNDARLLYQDLWSQQYRSKDMTLKLAFIHEGLGQPPMALYYLETYTQLFGPDQDVRQHINALASKHQLDGYQRSDVDFLYAHVVAWKNPISIALLVIMLVWATIAIWKRSRSAVAFLVCTIACLFLLQTLNTSTSTIIVTRKAHVRDLPSAGATVVTTLQPGHKLTLLGTNDVWLHVQYGQGIGYIRKDQGITL